jgi:hypothetical protein
MNLPEPEYAPAPSEHPDPLVTPFPQLRQMRTQPGSGYYDPTSIPFDMDGDGCVEGCLRWICHYDEGEDYGYHLEAGPRTMAAHMAQHPRDYVDDSYDWAGRPCDGL